MVKDFPFLLRDYSSVVNHVFKVQVKICYSPPVKKLEHFIQKYGSDVDSGHALL